MAKVAALVVFKKLRRLVLEVEADVEVEVEVDLKLESFMSPSKW
jgi:hypothetical protein